MVGCNAPGAFLVIIYVYFVDIVFYVLDICEIKVCSTGLIFLVQRNTTGSLQSLYSTVGR